MLSEFGIFRTAGSRANAFVYIKYILLVVLVFLSGFFFYEIKYELMSLIGLRRPQFHRFINFSDVAILNEKKTHERAQHSHIPRIIHQIWIGRLDDAYCDWIDTFRIDFIRQNPDYVHKIWNTEIFEKKYGPLKNRAIYDLETNIASKADILRYEILFHEGGIYIDADSVWLGRPIKEIFESKSAIRTGLVLGVHFGAPEWESDSFSHSLLYANGVIGVSKHHPAMKHVILNVMLNYGFLFTYPYYIRTGPFLFSFALAAVNFSITAIHTDIFYPSGWFHNHDESVSDRVIKAKKNYPESVFYQVGMNTNSKGFKRQNCTNWSIKLKMESGSF